ncbi:MAG: hypothetical protein ABIJ97_18150, partial [Bacteroidota bacterium]
MKIFFQYSYIITTFFFLIFSDCLDAQTTFRGVVTDVFTGEYLDNVKVSLQKMDRTNYTDIEGFFSFNILSPDPMDTSTLNGDFFCTGMQLKWDFNTGFNLLIIDVSGKKIFNNQDVSKNGWLNIDFEKDGIYYIKLTSQKG